MAVMRKLTENIGGDSVKSHNPVDAAAVRRILISRPNGRLGNLLLITPLLEEVTHVFPNARIDLFVKGGIARELFRNYPKIDRTIQLPNKPFIQLLRYAGAWLSLKSRRYDIVINVVHYSSSGRLSTKFATARHKFFGDAADGVLSAYPDHNHVAKRVVYSLRNDLQQLGIGTNNLPVAPLSLGLTPFELLEGRETLAGLTDNRKKTICLFTYATGNKRYSASWWGAYYKRLQAAFPDCNFVEVLPKENISQIGFSAPTFYSTDLRRIGAFIAAADVFIGADSGIMHLASAVHTPTLGLFSVTSPQTFGPYSNGSAAIDTNSVSFDEQVRLISAILSSTEPRHSDTQSA